MFQSLGSYIQVFNIPIDLEIMIRHDYANPGKVNVVKVFHFPGKIDLLKTFERDFKTDAGEVFVLRLLGHSMVLDGQQAQKRTATTKARGGKS